MPGIHLHDIEAAINWWRERKPSEDGVRACAEVVALAGIYAGMVYRQHTQVPQAQLGQAALSAWLGWYASTPDAPCIAICSTTQGDTVCKGCGRSFEEIQDWTILSPVEKRAVWHRITREQKAWRFNRYAERAQGQVPNVAT
jgi:predicted Fe-S protein YdhL (DUF1289 family)